MFIIFHLGRHPFWGPNDTVSIHKLVTGKFSSIVTAEYDKELVDLCHRMISSVCVERGDEVEYNLIGN
jgi:hypothetical protein